MKLRRFLASLPIGLLGCNPLIADTPDLLVMLQGESTKELVGLVESAGGKITHELQIIDAVGAKMSRAQLDTVLASERVQRYIDDLSVSEAPSPLPGEGELPECEVAGALELQYDSDSLSWTIHNKGSQAAELTTLTMEWPRWLGTPAKLSLAGRTIPLGSTAAGKPGSLTLSFDERPPGIKPGASDLRAEFAKPANSPANAPLFQRDFRLKAEFGNDCATELIPGYPDNHLNFHYSAVAGAEALHKLGVTGEGVTVAVLDSGLWEHPALARNSRGEPRVVARFDAINNKSGDVVFDESGHGTHMTSVIAHSSPIIRNGSPSGGFNGIAPDVSLVAVKAFDHEGQGDFLDIIRGVQWVVDNRKAHNIRVLNLSFASRPRWSYWQDPVNQAVMRAWASGITVVAAAGNEGPEPMSVGSPGNLPYIITVGAVTDSWTPGNRDDDYIPDFSSRGPTPSGHIKPDLVAPGGHITGITRPGSSLTLEHPNYLLSTGEFVMTGSSQASALVAGIAALLLQLEPELTPDQVKCKLISSAEPAINHDGLWAYSPFTQGHGYASATRAVTLGSENCANTELDLNKEINGQEHFQGPAVVAEGGKPGLPGLETMLSPLPADKGMSKTRKWGVKDHIERMDSSPPTPPRAADFPFDWELSYEQERAAIEALSDPGR